METCFCSGKVFVAPIITHNFSYWLTMHNTSRPILCSASSNFISIPAKKGVLARPLHISILNRTKIAEFINEIITFHLQRSCKHFPLWPQHFVAFVPLFAHAKRKTTTRTCMRDIYIKEMQRTLLRIINLSMSAVSNPV